MGYFSDEATTKKIEFPSNPEFWAEIKTDLTYGDMVRMGAIKPDGQTDVVASGEALMQQLIVDWNLTDKDGNKVEINIENIRRIKSKDAIAIMQEVNDTQVVDSAAKKNSTEQPTSS